MVSIRCGKVTFPNIEAVIFDKDGTLEDSQVYLRELAYKRSRLIDAQIPGIGEPLLMAFGVQDDTLDPTGLMAVGSRRENEIAAAAYIAETGRGWLESLAIAGSAFVEAEKYWQDAAGTSPMFAGSLEVLKFLWEAGLKLGILSADSTAGVKAFVHRHQLDPYIELQQGVDSEISKPDPRLFLQGCQSLGIKPASTLMVGDSAGDIEMAKGAGAAGCIGICWGKPEASHLQGADIAIASLDEMEII
ncbi:MAG: HAD family hydrolase [Moorea sp. SIO2I5]|nr:HAD family hydrolase [Moorena sp. SIO2I5]